LEEVWVHAYKKCLENADQYAKDAITLKENGSYGHALALAMIGQEEASKAFFYFVIGVLKEAKEEELSEKWLKEIRSPGAHEKKLELGILALPMEKVIDIGVYGAKMGLPGLQNRARRGESLEKLTREGLERYAVPGIKLLEELKRPAKRKSGKIQKLKKRGLYVDVSKDRKVVHGPFDIMEKDVTEELDRLNEIRRIADGYIKFVMSFPSNVRIKSMQINLNP
jgi:AbiV family abortive infection protein